MNETYILTVCNVPGRPGTFPQRLRSFLKHASRAYGIRCVEIEPTMKVRELLSDASKWRQGADIIYGAMCLTNAVMVCYPSTRKRFAVLRAISDRVGQPASEWSDAPGRTFEEIKAVAEELDI